MFWMKLFHIVLGIIFPLISNKCLLPVDNIIYFFNVITYSNIDEERMKVMQNQQISEECAQKKIDPINISGFKSFILLMIVCGTIHMNKILIEEIEFRFKHYYEKISTFALWLLLVLSSLNVCNYIYEFYAFILYYIGLIVLVIFGLVFRIRLGFSEAIFNLVVVPLVVLMSCLIMTMKFNIDTVVKFSPLNLLFIVYSITQTSYIKQQKTLSNNNNSDKKKDTLQQSDSEIAYQKRINSRVTIFELLGKHDCFRVMVLIMAYIYLYSIVEATKSKSIMYLLPLFIFSKTFYTTAILFKQEKYHQAKIRGQYLYIFYVFFYIGCLLYS